MLAGWTPRVNTIALDSLTSNNGIVYLCSPQASLYYHLEDHPMTRKWPRSTVRESPKWGCGTPSTWPKWFVKGVTNWDGRPSNPIRDIPQNHHRFALFVSAPKCEIWWPLLLVSTNSLLKNMFTAFQRSPGRNISIICRMFISSTGAGFRS